jgi:hypothetical protein
MKDKITDFIWILRLHGLNTECRFFRIKGFRRLRLWIGTDLKSPGGLIDLYLCSAGATAQKGKYAGAGMFTVMLC